MHTFTRLVLVLGLVTASAGCRSKDRVENRFDPTSQMRLATIADSAHVVMACRFTTPPESVPARSATELGRAGSSVLFEVPKANLDAVSNLKHIERAAVWGDVALMAKLDQRLKQELLVAWDEGRRNPMPLMARFNEGTPEVKEALAREGATPRTVAGPVVTLDADPETILRIATLPGLVSLSTPRTVSPLETSP